MSASQNRCFLNACYKGDCTALEKLLKAGVKPDHVSFNGRPYEGVLDTILGRHPKALSLLFAYGLRVTPSGWHSIILTFIGSYADTSLWNTESAIRQILLHYGADFTIVDEQGNTVLWECVDDKEACQAAIALGVNPRLRNKKGQTAYHRALELIDLEIERQHLIREATSIATSEDMLDEMLGKAGVDCFTSIDYDPQFFDLEIKGYVESLEVLRPHSL